MKVVITSLYTEKSGKIVWCLKLIEIFVAKIFLVAFLLQLKSLLSYCSKIVYLSMFTFKMNKKFFKTYKSSTIKNEQIQVLITVMYKIIRLLQHDELAVLNSS